MATKTCENCAGQGNTDMGATLCSVCGGVGIVLSPAPPVSSVPFAMSGPAASEATTAGETCCVCPMEVRNLAACAFNVGANRNDPQRLPEKLDRLADAVSLFQPLLDRHFEHEDAKEGENLDVHDLERAAGDYQIPEKRALEMVIRLRQDYGHDIRNTAAQRWLVRCLGEAEQGAIAKYRLENAASSTAVGREWAVEIVEGMRADWSNRAAMTDEPYCRHDQDRVDACTKILAAFVARVRTPEPVRHDDAKDEAVARDVERDLKGELVLGYRVAAYRETDPQHGKVYGHRYSEHWSMPNRVNPSVVVERLFTEEQLRDALAAANPILPAPEPSAGMEPTMPMARALYQHVSDLGIHGPEPKVWEQQTAEHRKMWLLALTAALRADTRQDMGGTE